MRIDLNVGRQVELDAVLARVVGQPDLHVEETDRIVEPDRLAGLAAVDRSPGRHAFARHLEEQRRLRRVGTPRPQPNRPGIARRGHIAAPGAAQQERVGIEPARGALGLGQNITVDHEGFAWRGRTRAGRSRRCRRATGARSRGHACPAASRRHSRSSLRARPPQAHRRRAGFPRKAARGESSRASSAATGRAAAAHPSRNCRSTARAARCTGILSGRSRIAARTSRSAAKPAVPKAASVRSFCASTQATARGSSISSSHRYGSSSGAAIVGLTSSDTGMNSTQYN